MDILKQAKKEIVSYLEQNIGAKHSDSIVLEAPPGREMGDFAFPCHTLAKTYKKSPAEIASNLQEVLTKQLGSQQSKTIIRRVESSGPYLNFFIDKEWLARKMIPEILEKKDRFARSDLGKGKKVMVEYVSPNTNKPLHLGHIRNMALGWSVIKILEKVGYTVVKGLLINDRGVHICKSMLAFSKWGPQADDKKLKGDFLVGKYYVMFSQKAKEDPKLQEEAQEMLRKWEAGDRKVLALWKKMNKLALSGHSKTYNDFGISFDKEYLESDLYMHGKDIVKEGLDKKIFKEHEGAIMVELEKYGLADKILQRSDGTSIYMTQDLYLGVKKVKENKLDANIYVVASEQDLHFKQLFKILELLGYEWAKDCYHLSYGMVYLPEGKMKSREGTVVDADGMMRQLEEMSEKELAKRYNKLSKKEIKQRATQIALGAIKYYILQVDPSSDMHYNPKESLSFAGRTGPYLQYTQARIGSILKKARITDAKKLDFTKLAEPEEQRLVFVLAQFPEIVEASASKYDPAIIAKYIYDLASEFNNFYHKHQVLKAEGEIKQARLALIKAVRIIIQDGLELLGIESPTEM